MFLAQGLLIIGFEQGCIRHLIEGAARHKVLPQPIRNHVRVGIHPLAGEVFADTRNVALEHGK